MNRRVRILLVLLILALGFGGWQWIRPYQWSPDPSARAEIQFSQIKRDQSFAWLDVYLKITDPALHDLEKPVRLILADGTKLKQADITRVGTKKRPIDAISFRFWLEIDKLAGPLQLQINDGTLLIRKEGAAPDLAPRETNYHNTTRW